MYFLPFARAMPAWTAEVNMHFGFIRPYYFALNSLDIKHSWSPKSAKMEQGERESWDNSSGPFFKKLCRSHKLPSNQTSEGLFITWRVMEMGIRRKMEKENTPLHLNCQETNKKRLLPPPFLCPWYVQATPSMFLSTFIPHSVFFSKMPCALCSRIP